MTEHSREISNQINVQLAVGMRVRVYRLFAVEGVEVVGASLPG